MTPEIAIVDSNTLSCLGLQNLLEEIIPTAIIRSFRSFGELMDDTPDMYDTVGDVQRNAVVAPLYLIEVFAARQADI